MDWLSRVVGRPVAVVVLASVLGGCAGFRLPWSGDAGPAVETASATDDHRIAAVRMRVAETALRHKDPATAERLYRAAHEAMPEAAPPLIGLGETLYAQGRHEAATETFRAAMKRDPASAPAIEGLAKSLMSEGNHAEARTLLETAAGEKANASLLNKLGVARDFAGEGDAAQQAYRSALALEPGNDAARNNLALSLALSGRNEEAAAEMERLVAAHGANARYRANLAFIYGMAGNMAAVERLNGALNETERRHLDARYARLRTLAASGDRKTVLGMIEDGMKADAQPPKTSSSRREKQSEGIVQAKISGAKPAEKDPKGAAAAPAWQIPPASREAEPPAAPVGDEPAATEAGSWRVQLAAYRTLAHTERGAAIFRHRAGGLLPTMEALVHIKSNSDAAAVSFRLRTAPLADRLSAEKLCAALQERSLPCLVIRQQPGLWVPAFSRERPPAERRTGFAPPAPGRRAGRTLPATARRRRHSALR